MARPSGQFSQHKKDLLLILRQLQSKDGAFPSTKFLADKLGVGTRQIYRYLAELRKEGKIVTNTRLFIINKGFKAKRAVFITGQFDPERLNDSYNLPEGSPLHDKVIGTGVKAKIMSKNIISAPKESPKVKATKPTVNSTRISTLEYFKRQAVKAGDKDALKLVEKSLEKAKVTQEVEVTDSNGITEKVEVRVQAPKPSHIPELKANNSTEEMQAFIKAKREEIIASLPKIDINQFKHKDFPISISTKPHPYIQPFVGEDALWWQQWRRELVGGHSEPHIPREAQHKHLDKIFARCKSYYKLNYGLDLNFDGIIKKQEERFYKFYVLDDESVA